MEKLFKRVEESGRLLFACTCFLLALTKERADTLVRPTASEASESLHSPISLLTLLKLFWPFLDLPQNGPTLH